MYNWNDGTDVLMHHGIKGQKWGQRRFQNEDGSLTPAGQARYNASEAKKTYKQAKREYRKADARRVANEYNYSNSFIKTPSMRAEIDRSRGEAQKKAVTLNEAKSAYKAAKKEARKQIRAENIKKGKEVVSKISNKMNNMTKTDIGKYTLMGMGVANTLAGSTFGAYSNFKNAYEVNKLQKEGILK